MISKYIGRKVVNGKSESRTMGRKQSCGPAKFDGRKNIS
jgi:hypothetical protein